ncbi:MAG: glycosyltransferase family 2 protein [Bacteroidota bacterium]
MENKSAITIIMPAYNAEKYVHKAISSIIDQSFTDWELLIGDDCSTDNTLNILQKFSNSDQRIKVFQHHENLGYLLNSNILWANAKGKYITFLDADDWSDRNRLDIQHSFLENNKNIHICDINYYRVDENNTIISKVILDQNIPLSQQIHSFLFENGPFPIFSNGLFFRKEVSDKIGYYHEFYSRKCGEDWDWSLRVYQHFKIARLPDLLYYYRENSEGVTQKLTIDKLINKSLIAKIYQVLDIENKNLFEPQLKDELYQLEANLKTPYLNDNSLLPFEQACNNIYHKHFKLALKNILIAISHRPLNFKYYRYLKFILTRILFKH